MKPVTQAQPAASKRHNSHQIKLSSNSIHNYATSQPNGGVKGGEVQPQVIQKSVRHKQVRSNHGSNNSSLHRTNAQKNYSTQNNSRVRNTQGISIQQAQQI